MAEEAAAGAAAKGSFDFLKTKLGPLPIAAWGAVFLALYLYMQYRQKQSAGTSSTGTLDPATGFVAGSVQDQNALAGQGGLGGGNQDNSASSQAGSGSTTAGQYATNADWARAAVNYLVGLGIDPTTASQAVQQYLSSQTLASDQQGDVNLVIQALGAPPTLPVPTQTNPTPLPGVGGGTVNATNPPTGLALATIVSTLHTMSLKWNRAANATGYTISYGLSPDATGNQTSAPGNQPGITIGNLNPGSTYYFKVQATPAAAGAGWAGPISGKTLPTSAASAPAPTATSTPAAAAPPTGGFTMVTVVPWTATNPPWNSTLNGIATHYNVVGGYQKLAQINGISNPNVIHPGQQIKVPT